MLPDGIHPNEKAQELIANLVYVSLYPILFLEKKWTQSSSKRAIPEFLAV